MRLIASLCAIAVLRIMLFACLVFALGNDPNIDTRIFEYLANKDWKLHLSGGGEYSFFPAFSVPIMFALSVIFKPIFGDYWFRGVVLIAELIAYTVLYKKVAGFRASWLDYFFIAGVFTAPLTAIWAQDEMIAVLPALLLFITPSSIAIFSLVSVISFLTLKNFYLFFPFTHLLSRDSYYVSIVALTAIVTMILLDNTSNFVPDNQFGTTLWSLSSLDYGLQKTASLALFSGALAASLIIALWRRLTWQTLYFLIFSAFLNIFYHVNLEYLVFLTLPAIVMYCRCQCSIWTLWLIILWFVSAVFSNIVYALGYSLASFEIARSLHFIAICVGSFLGLATFFAFIFLDSTTTGNRSFDTKQ